MGRDELVPPVLASPDGAADPPCRVVLWSVVMWSMSLPNSLGNDVSSGLNIFARCIGMHVAAVGSRRLLAVRRNRSGRQTREYAFDNFFDSVGQAVGLGQ